jgi:hypothetical protein
VESVDEVAPEPVATLDLVIAADHEGGVRISG